MIVVAKIIDVIRSQDGKAQYMSAIGNSTDPYSKYNKLFVWKSPYEDFNTMSQLIVDESEEALFFANGQALDLFGPGRYTLTTQNIPFIKKVLNLPTGGVTPFHCKVYFINKTVQMAIKWGTDQHVEYIDNKYKFPLSLGASGEMSLRVSDSRKIIEKLVGTESVLSQETVTIMLRGILLEKFKSIFTREIVNCGIDIFEIDAHLDELSSAVHEQLIEPFADYGLSIDRFMIVRVVKPEGNSTYERLKKLHFMRYAGRERAKLHQEIELINEETESQKTVMKSQAAAKSREIEGYTYQQERQFNIAEKAVENQGVGEIVNTGIGLGTMVGFGASVASNIASTVNASLNEPNNESIHVMHCPGCGSAISVGAKFCPECGMKISDDDSIICQKCGKSVSRGKFCSECGSPLYVKCKNCGKELYANSKFCPECGAKL